MDKNCIICNQVKSEGFYLIQHFICMDCHHDIVHSSTSDEKYQFYVDRLKKLTDNKIYS